MVHSNQIHIDTNEKKKNLSSKLATINFFKLISKNLVAGDVIFLHGALGVGKTFCSSVIIKELTGASLVTSPTFNLVQTYFVKNNLEIWHCDFYRLNHPQEVNEIGVFDNTNEKIILIEWPKFTDIFYLNPLIIEIEFGMKNNERSFNFTLSPEWDKRINF